MDLPKVRFGNYMITRLICGGNPFCGNSHYSDDMNRDMAQYYTPERVVEVLKRCEAAGINTVQARGDYHRVLYWIELYRREGGRMHWIAQTASEMHDVHQNIGVLAAAGAAGIYHHGSKTDKLWLEGHVDKVQDYLKTIRDCGVMVGLGTHIPEVIEYSEEKGWDVDFYMACFYNISRRPRESALVSGKAGYGKEEYRYPEDPIRMCETIRKTPRTCLAFKIFGAGRRCGTQEDVRQAFGFTFENIKPIDAVVVGMFPKYVDQITLNCNYTMEACSVPSQE